MAQRKPSHAPRDDRSKAKTEADEIEAIRESFDTATEPVGETLRDEIEPPLALDVQGDLPGIEDNTPRNAPPGWDKARALADEKPVGAGPGDENENPGPAHPHAAAFRDAKPAGPEDSEVQVRPAGPGATRSRPRNWDEVDEAVDESFPASDPAARY